MVESHDYTFYGNTTWLTIYTSSKSEPAIYFRLIKKKEDKTWEKSSDGEGKLIKFSLEEIACVLRVLEKSDDEWSIVHSFNEAKKRICFNWSKEEKYTLWFEVENYTKKLNYGQIEIMRRLLNHILDEKIGYATIPSNLESPIIISKSI